MYPTRGIDCQIFTYLSLINEKNWGKDLIWQNWKLRAKMAYGSQRYYELFLELIIR